jgi:hemerythrin-like domain-containing protein
VNGSLEDEKSIREDGKSTRRNFLRAVVPVAATAALIGPAQQVFAIQSAAGEKEDEVSTNEDLMREHGILKRVLLVYGEIIRRVEAKQDFQPQSLTDAANIIRNFIENYHEKLEEDHLFPRFRKAGKLVDLVDVLYKQHQAGRTVTDRILAAIPKLKTQDDRKALATDLHAFNRMYAPHEAREDTVLFPELHKIVSSHEYDSLGEQFEKIERQTFHGDGFDIYVDKIAGIEKQLGIYDLAQFTPQ